MNVFILRRVNIAFDGSRQVIETCTVFDAVQEQDQIRFIRENGESGYCFDSEDEKWELEQVCS